jgi:CRP/FNR family transcriptional regulator, cyclic AMP receptor protein
MDQQNNNVDESLILPVLRQIPLFSGLDESLHREIIQHIVLMYYPENYKLFGEGEAGDALYIIKNGKVSIFRSSKEETTPPEEIAELTDNGFFGEMALVSDAPRNASAKTTADSEIFILSKDDFKKLIESNTVLAEHVSSTMVDRINENDAKN